MSAFHLKMCPLSVFLLDLDDREKLKRKKKKKNKKSRGKGRRRSLGGFMFSLHITKSLIASREFTCLFGSGGTEGGERKKGKERGMGAAS